MKVSDRFKFNVATNFQMRLIDWFKSKPYWLRGGLIGLAIWALLAVPMTFCAVVGGGICEALIAWVGTFLTLPSLIVFIFFRGAPIFSGSLLGALIGTFIGWFLAGSLIGLIYGKIEQRVHAKVEGVEGIEKPKQNLFKIIVIIIANLVYAGFASWGLYYIYGLPPGPKFIISSIPLVLLIGAIAIIIGTLRTKRWAQKLNYAISGIAIGIAALIFLILSSGFLGDLPIIFTTLKMVILIIAMGVASIYSSRHLLKG